MNRGRGDWVREGCVNVMKRAQKIRAALQWLIDHPDESKDTRAERMHRYQCVALRTQEQDCMEQLQVRRELYESVQRRRRDPLA